MTINILTLFPEYFVSPLQTSILGRAIEDHQVMVNIINIREFTTDKHHVTDDRPYGGGAGMVMKIEPIDRALQSIEKTGPVILTSAKGRLFTQQSAQRYAQQEQLTLICGHYEGVDERVVEHFVDEEVRIGNYVLTGGEPAVAVIADAVVRLLPGVLGNEESLKDESHTNPGRLSHPVYTRPDNYRGWQVPEVLLSGNHQEIKNWQRDHADSIFHQDRTDSNS